LAKYWAEALAKQSKDAELQAQFAQVSAELNSNENAIVTELNNAQGSPVDLDGYYFPNDDKAAKAMRPSNTLNSILAKL